MAGWQTGLFLQVVFASRCNAQDDGQENRQIEENQGSAVEAHCVYQFHHQTVIDLLAEALTPFFLFLAAGRGASSPFNNLEQRAWVLLFACRPDLLAGDDCGAAAARRWGIDQAAVTSLVREFEAYVPGFRSLGGGTKRRSDSVRLAVSRARHREQLQRETGSDRPFLAYPRRK